MGAAGACSKKASTLPTMVPLPSVFIIMMSTLYYLFCCWCATMEEQPLIMTLSNARTSECGSQVYRLCFCVRPGFLSLQGFQCGSRRPACANVSSAAFFFNLRSSHSALYCLSASGAVHAALRLCSSLSSFLS